MERDSLPDALKLCFERKETLDFRWIFEFSFEIEHKGNAFGCLILKLQKEDKSVAFTNRTEIQIVNFQMRLTKRLEKQSRHIGRSLSQIQ